MRGGGTRLAVYVGLAGMFLGQIARLSFPDPDIFHAMALFRESLALGWVPKHDLYAYTPTVYPSIHHEWGTGAVLYAVTVATGWGAAGLMGLKYLLAFGTAAGCVLCARRRGASDAVIALMIPVAVWLGWIGFTTIRAQHFTLFFLVCLLLLLEEDRRGRRWWIAAWLPLYWLWLNIHGGFVVGAGLFAFYAAEQFARAFAREWSARSASRTLSLSERGASAPRFDVGNDEQSEAEGWLGARLCEPPADWSSTDISLGARRLDPSHPAVTDPSDTESIHRSHRGADAPRSPGALRAPLVTAVRATRHLIAVGIAMAVLPLLNPYGFDYLPYLWHALRMERARITEWGPLWQRSQPAFILSVYGLSLLAVAYAAWKRGLASLPGLPMVLITALLALQHIRHGSIYAVVWLCLAPAFLRGTRFGHGLRRAWQKAPQLATGLALLFGAAGYVSAVQQRFWELKIPTAEAIGPLVYPVGAVDYLARTEFHGHVMSPFRAGSYISWKLHPAVKVSFDGRYEAAYPPGALEENFDFYAGHDAWRETLTRYDTHLVLVPRGDAVEGLLERLEAEDGSWRRVYHDDGFALFARADVATELPHEDRGGTAIVAEFP